MSSISFFTPLNPITAGDGKTTHTLLKRVDGYFHLFQKVAHVTHTPPKKLDVTEIVKLDQSALMIALKIASYCTLIIPLIMLIIKAIVRSHYTIEETSLDLDSQSAHTSSAQEPADAQTWLARLKEGPLSEDDKRSMYGFRKTLENKDLIQLIEKHGLLITEDLIKKNDDTRNSILQNYYDSVMKNKKTLDKIPETIKTAWSLQNHWFDLINEGKASLSDIPDVRRLYFFTLSQITTLIENNKVTDRSKIPDWIFNKFTPNNQEKILEAFQAKASTPQ